MAFENDDLFPAIWEALTSDGLQRLLAPLMPKPHGDGYLTLTCPACKRREAWAYPPKNGKGVVIHCNRGNHCRYEAKLWDYLLERNGGDKKATFRELAEAAGVSIDRPSGGRGRIVAQMKPLKPLSVGCAPVDENTIHPDTDQRQAEYSAALAGSPAAEYLIGRGVSLDAAIACGMGYCAVWREPWQDDGDGVSLGARLTSPFRDNTGRIVGIEGRLLPGQDEKRLRKCRFYGAKGAGVFSPNPRVSIRELLTRDDSMHLTEGVFDAFALRKCGHDVFALGGANFPEWLLKSLWMKTSYAAFDHDEGGEKHTLSLRERLRGRGSVVYDVKPPDDGRDWGSYLTLSPAEIRAAYKRARGWESADAYPAAPPNPAPAAAQLVTWGPGSEGWPHNVRPARIAMNDGAIVYVIPPGRTPPAGAGIDGPIMTPEEFERTYTGTLGGFTRRI